VSIPKMHQTKKTRQPKNVCALFVPQALSFENKKESLSMSVSFCFCVNFSFAGR
jgi:hypothetical protein